MATSKNGSGRHALVLAILLATLLATGVGPASAQSYPQGMQPASAGAQMGQAEGKIKSVDPSGRMLELEDGTMLTIPATAGVQQEALREGAIVKASFEERDGQKIVTSIEITPGM
jgi:Cu/Ag efflux protein CusF